MVDHYLELGGDLIVDNNGEILEAEDWDEIRQFFLRLLMTNPFLVQANGVIVPPDLVFHPEFGVGCRAELGQLRKGQTIKTIESKIRIAIAGTPELASTPQPIIQVTPLEPFGLRIFLEVYLRNNRKKQIVVVDDGVGGAVNAA